MSARALDAAIRHAIDRYPLEACGVVVEAVDGRLCFLAVENVADDPESRYELDPAAQFRIWRAAAAGAFALRAIVHSHPDGTAAFSEVDRAFATERGRPLHPGLAYWVLAIGGRPPGATDARSYIFRDGVWHFVSLMSSGRHEDEILQNERISIVSKTFQGPVVGPGHRVGDTGRGELDPRAPEKADIRVRPGRTSRSRAEDTWNCTRDSRSGSRE